MAISTPLLFLALLLILPGILKIWVLCLGVFAFLSWIVASFMNARTRRRLDEHRRSRRRHGPVARGR
ncbi:MAG: hypothetical protein H6807_09050 [Planctomycetes bacterium]|nr:hypothetical protein [Planctomycetota bacterium]